MFLLPSVSVPPQNAEYAAVKSEFESHCGRHNTLLEQYHPSHIQTNLKVAVMEADEGSEKLAEKFLDRESKIEMLVYIHVLYLACL